VHLTYCAEDSWIDTSWTKNSSLGEQLLIEPAATVSSVTLGYAGYSKDDNGPTAFRAGAATFSAFYYLLMTPGVSRSSADRR